MFDLYTIHVGALLFELFIPGSNSLKSKRRVLLSLKDRIRGSFNVSVAELAELDKWQRAVCGVVMIANDKAHIDSTLQAVLQLIRDQPEAQLGESRIEFL